MNIVSFGGGVNSAAMLVGMYQRGIPIDLILFADVGAERPEIYAFLHEMNDWLRVRGLPPITVVENVPLRTAPDPGTGVLAGAYAALHRLRA